MTYEKEQETSCSSGKAQKRFFTTYFHKISKISELCTLRAAGSSLTLLKGLNMKLNHPALVNSLQKAYSGEKAAAFAYIGHANSLKNPEEKAAVRQIEKDEWGHRKNVLAIMRQYDIPVSRYYEARFHAIGRVISASCHVIGWFMPYFFAGKLESGNVCEYFVMMQHFHSLGITEHDEILYEMGMKEKDHEVYFLNQIKASWMLPIFERIFYWGSKSSLNDVDIENRYTVAEAEHYCKSYRTHAG